VSSAHGILHVITSKQRRGAETFAVDLDLALQARGVVSEVVALAPGSQGSVHMLDVPALGDSPLSPSTLLALRRRAASASLVVAHGSRTLPACTAALAGRRTPAVYRSIGDPNAWSGKGLRRLRTRWMLRGVAAVVTFWPQAGDTVRTLHGVPADRIRVIRKGVPADRCPVPDEAARQAARGRFRLPLAAPVVACIGALSPEKRVGDAVEAVAALPEVHLLVVGDGPERSLLERQAAGVAPGRVHFAGVLDGPTAALAAADLVALPSRTEGVPGVLIEAGLSGVAAVATDVGGVSQIVRDGETGFVVPPGDVSALADGLRRALEQRKALGLAAREHCLAHFEIGPVAAQWATLAEELGVVD
jgi:glycosyltransferase involved in cell wall biosynthesis